MKYTIRWFVINGRALPYEVEASEYAGDEETARMFACEYDNFEMYESISNIGCIGLLARCVNGELTLF